MGAAPYPRGSDPSGAIVQRRLVADRDAHPGAPLCSPLRRSSTIVTRYVPRGSAFVRSSVTPTDRAPRVLCQLPGRRGRRPCRRVATRTRTRAALAAARTVTEQRTLTVTRPFSSASRSAGAAHTSRTASRPGRPCGPGGPCAARAGRRHRGRPPGPPRHSRRPVHDRRSSRSGRSSPTPVPGAPRPGTSGALVAFAAPVSLRAVTRQASRSPTSALTCLVYDGPVAPPIGVPLRSHVRVKDVGEPDHVPFEQLSA